MVTSAIEGYPFASSFLETPAGRLHYLDEGPKDGPVLLMLHGNPTWSYYWRNLVLELRATHRCIVPDHLGCGLSDKPQEHAYTLASHVDNVIRLVEHLELRGITLVVHDWGGAIGMGFAVRHPERVARLVVFNTAAFPSERMPKLIALARVPGFGALAIRGFNAFARVALLTCVAHRERLTPGVRAGYLAPYDGWANRVATLRFVQDIPMSAAHPTYAVLADIDRRLASLRDLPMIVLWGGKDFVFDDHFLAEWQRRFPAAEVHRFEDAGHYVVEDAHDRIVALLRPFLAAPAPGPPGRDV